MIIVVPYVDEVGGPGGLHPATLPRLLDAARDEDVVKAVNVGGADTHYYELLRRLWAAGETFAVVEQDIEVAVDTIEHLHTCPELWCAHSYPIYWGGLAEMYGGPYGLGCVRFRAELIAAWPCLLNTDVPTYSAEVSGVVRDGRYWMNLDAAVSHWLRGPYGVQVHRHQPDVTHHHVYDYAGAYVTDEVRAKLPDGHPLKEVAAHG